MPSLTELLPALPWVVPFGSLFRLADLRPDLADVSPASGVPISVIIPARNERDFAEVPAEIKDEMEVHFVSRLDQVLPLVLAEPSAEDADTDAEAASADEASA